jgi:hypothetical protein
MKYESYKLLEDKFDNKDFHKSYKPINVTLYVFSLFGNLASVFFAYFFLYNILSEAVGGLAAATVLSAAAIFFLASFELLKRYVFHRFSLEWVSSKFKVTLRETAMLGIFSVLLISTSFYMSLNGADKFADKTDNIEANVDSLYKQYEDSLVRKYSVWTEELKVENQKLSDANVTYNQEAENTKFTSIKKQKFDLIKSNNQTIKDNKLKLDNYEKELAQKLKDKKTELETDSNNDKQQNSSSGFKFVLLSTFIELMILIGILFNNYYSHRAYKEYTERVSSDENFIKWQKYDAFLDIIYKNGKKVLKPGEESMPVSKVQDLARIRGLYTTEREVVDGYKVFNHLRITATRSGRRFVTSDYDLAKDVLKRHFNVS